MLEMLVCLIVIMALMLISLNNTNNMDLKHYYFLNDYLLTQTESMIHKEIKDVGHGVYFNGMGHVNQARTINFMKHDIVIHLGNGYATIK